MFIVRIRKICYFYNSQIHRVHNSSRVQLRKIEKITKVFVWEQSIPLRTASTRIQNVVNMSQFIYIKRNRDI